MKNVLVFPCGTEIGLEIHRSLSNSTHFKLFGGSSKEDHGQFVYKNYIGNVPFVDSKEFIQEMNKLTESYDIDYIIPAHDSVVLRLAQAEADNELKAKVITSPYETCRISRSKGLTYKFFDKTINTPRLFPGIHDIGANDFPVFLKPDVGQGSKGTRLARSLAEVEFYLEKDPSLLIMEYLPGPEYTIDCFTDFKGQLLYCSGRIRERISNGISVRSSPVNNPRFMEIATNINERLKFRGAWFFQLKERLNKDLVLLEIAPRVAGTMGVNRILGVNLPLLSLFDAQEISVEIQKNNFDVVIDRALTNSFRHNIKYSHVYLDFDDLVIYDKFVNPSIIAFIFQCFNKGVKVHLITKHKEDINITLKKYRLQNMFDEVIVLKENDSKHLYIHIPDSIFIDDSFIERKKVSEYCKIPVFDAHMIEGLIEIF